MKTLDEAERQADWLNAQTGSTAATYRRVLTERESMLWHHAIPDMATRRQNVLIEETAAAAADGFDAFAIFDLDETLLARGARTDDQ